MPRPTVRRAAKRNVEHPDVSPVSVLHCLLEGRRGRMRRTADRPGTVRATEDMISHLEALALARAGQLQDARRMAAVAVDIAQKSDQRERAALFDAATAVWDAFYGDAAAAQAEGHQGARARQRRREVDYAAAFALALAGDLTQSRALADDLARETFPRIRRCNTCICRRCGPCSR